MSANTISAAFVAAFLAGAVSCAAAQSRPNTTSKSSAPAASDSGTSVPNALQGFQQNRGQPVKIEASRLEVRDKDKVATFSGNVKVVQGDTTMHCKVLVVFYEKKDEAQGAPTGSQPGAFFGEPQGLCASRSRYAAKILYISEKLMTHA